MRLIFLSFTLLFSCSLLAAGGSGGGNGGDIVRMRFLSIGHNLVDYYTKGFSQIRSVVSDPEELRRYLTINVISTSVDLLLDNRGNPVSAIGERNKIILYVGEDYPELSWSMLLQNIRLSQKMVLHEMLRAHGVNDDDYKYSEIVLKDQDILTNGAFKLKWGQDSFNSINSGLVRSLKALSKDEEVKIYEKSINELKRINNLPYAGLLSIQTELSQKIASQDGFEKHKIFLLRNDLRTTKDLIPLVDLVAYKKIKYNESNIEDLKKIALLLLRDLSSKYIEYNHAGNALFLEHVTNISTTLGSDDNFTNSCIDLFQQLDSIKESLVQEELKRDVLRKIQMSVSALRQGMC